MNKAIDYELWLKNNSLAIDDILLTLESYLKKIENPKIESGKNNIIWQFKITLIKYFNFLLFLKKEWNYKNNNNNNIVYRLTNELLWMLLKDITIISYNISESNPNFPNDDEYLKFMKKFRNILHHHKIMDPDITLKTLFYTIENINNDIIDNSIDFFIKKSIESGSSAFWNKEENDYISICKLNFNESTSEKLIYEKVNDVNQIEKELIDYRFADFLEFEKPIHGELNSIDNFVSSVYMNQQYILHIKLIPIIYWGIEKIKDLLLL